jgi:hypothetical protein
MATRLFTVTCGRIKPGAYVQACTSESGDTFWVILIGRDKEELCFLPIKDFHVQGPEEAGAGIRIQTIEFDPETLELTACSDDAEADDEFILVVFSAYEGDAYFQGDTKAESHSGINGQIKPIGPKMYSPPCLEVAQFVQLLEKDGDVTAHARYGNTLHTEFYHWDGSRFHPVGKNTMAAL